MADSLPSNPVSCGNVSVHMTDTDLVSRLRTERYSVSATKLCAEAADEIKRLRRELAEAKATLADIWAYPTGTSRVITLRRERDRLRAALERIAHGGVTDCMIAQDIAANAIDGTAEKP